MNSMETLIVLIYDKGLNCKILDSNDNLIYLKEMAQWKKGNCEQDPCRVQSWVSKFSIL